MIYSYNGQLQSPKKEYTFAACNNVYECHRCNIEQNKLGSPFVWNLKTGNN